MTLSSPRISRSEPPSDSEADPETRLHVVTGADDSYRLPLAVTLASLLMNLSEESAITLHLLDSGLQPKTRRRLDELIHRLRPESHLSWYPVNSADYEHLELTNISYISLATYARLQIPELLSDVSRVIYLDSDLVVDGDLTALWNLDLQGRPLGAVQDSGIPVVGARYGIRSYEDLGLSPESPYFNAGVLLMNLDAWREEGVADRVLQYMTTYQGELVAYDQEGLNAVLCDQWHPLDFRWNVTSEFFQVDERIPELQLYEPFRRAVQAAMEGIHRSPAIIHYTSELKPWHGTSPHPMAERFFNYLRRSGWMNWAAYSVWRARTAALGVMDTMRDRSRGIRHKIGLKR